MSELRIQPGEEPVVAAAAGGLRALRRAGQVVRVRLPGDVDVPARGMDGDAVAIVVVDAAEIRRLQELGQARVQARDEGIRFAAHDRLGSALRSGKIDIVAPADDVHIAGARMNRDAVDVIRAAGPDIRALKDPGERSIEPGDEAVDVAGEGGRGRVRAAGSCGEVGRPRLAGDVDLAARRMDCQGMEVFGTAASEVCRLQKSAERRVETGDETVLVDEVLTLGGRGLRASGGAREIGRERLPGDIDLAADGMNRDRDDPVGEAAAEVRGAEECRQGRIEAGHEAVVASRVRRLRTRESPCEIGRAREACDVHVAARRVHGDAQDLLPVAAAEVRGVQQRRERRVESGDEAVHTAAACRVRVSGDEHVAGRGVDRDAR